jgi:hypothetical protein
MKLAGSARQLRHCLTLAVALWAGSMLLFTPVAHAAGCSAPATDYGSVTDTISVPSTGTYRIWSRMAAPNTTNNTYLLDVDSSSCYNVGGSTVPTYTTTQDTAGTRFGAGTTNWISQTTGGSQIDVSLTAGSHTLTLIGNAPGVVVDRLVLTQGATCQPTGLGDVCADVTPPTVTITSPTNGASVTSPITVNTSSSDDSGTVSKVELYVDGDTTATATDSASPFNFSNVALSAGSHTLTAKAYDAATNATTSSPVSITIIAGGGSDTTAPTVSFTSPTGGTPIIAGRAFPISVTASDASGIKSVIIQVDGSTIATLLTSPYAQNINTATLAPGAHTFRAQAMDSSTNQNTSAFVSAPVRVTDLTDVGRNCVVNFSDISSIVPNLGQTGSNLGASDVTGDSKVNFSDISAIVPKLGTIPC